MDQRVSRITSGDTTYELPPCYNCGGSLVLLKWVLIVVFTFLGALSVERSPAFGRILIIQ